MTRLEEQPLLTPAEDEDVQTAPEGSGPLLQRDYVAVIEGAPAEPEHLIEMLRADFPRFSPPALAPFARCGDGHRPLEVGDELEVVIRGTGCHKVRVVLVEPRALTLRTIAGHPEAGRITFGACRDEQGRLVFRIRSRARIRSYPAYLGYLMLGKKEQTLIWVTFIHNVAKTAGGRVQGDVHCSTRRVDETLADMGEVEAPTFPTD
jgi:hypothetical protein